MRLSGKSIVVALSVLFAATSVAPVGAATLPVVAIKPLNESGQVQLVEQRQEQWYRDRTLEDNYRVNPRRIYRKGWRDGNRGWRDDGGYRQGWYGGHRGYRYARPGYRRHDNGFWFPLAAFGAGAIIGGAIANDRAYSGGGSHVNWCANRYRSYRAYDNTYQPYGGPRRQCYSPYR